MLVVALEPMVFLLDPRDEMAGRGSIVSDVSDECCEHIVEVCRWAVRAIQLCTVEDRDLKKRRELEWRGVEDGRADLTVVAPLFPFVVHGQDLWRIEIEYLFAVEDLALVWRKLVAGAVMLCAPLDMFFRKV